MESSTPCQLGLSANLEHWWQKLCALLHWDGHKNWHDLGWMMSLLPISICNSRLRPLDICFYILYDQLQDCHLSRKLFNIGFKHENSWLWQKRESSAIHILFFDWQAETRRQATYVVYTNLSMSTFRLKCLFLKIDCLIELQMSLVESGSQDFEMCNQIFLF